LNKIENLKISLVPKKTQCTDGGLKIITHIITGDVINFVSSLFSTARQSYYMNEHRELKILE